MTELAAEPYAIELTPEYCALHEILGNDVSDLRPAVEPNRRVLAAWRAGRDGGPGGSQRYWWTRITVPLADEQI